jgi:hypothetical protein
MIDGDIRHDKNQKLRKKIEASILIVTNHE